MVMTKTHKLLLFNDNKHDFMYIMACLIKVLDHQREQAEQCTLITHHNGMCDIYSGDALAVFEKKNQLENLGLEVEVSEIEERT
jgi:ATP-dependent Clp protease adaptor protein ClpS